MLDNSNYGGILSTLLEAVELLKTFLGQELKKVVDENVIEPIMTAKSKLMTGIIAAVSLSIALIFFSFSAFLFLVEITGSYPISYLVIGAIFLIVGLLLLKKAK